MASPLLDLFGKEEAFCEYPVTLRIPMDDGTIQTYCLESSVSPVIRKASGILKQSINISIGYQFVPKKRRNRSNRGKR